MTKSRIDKENESYAWNKKSNRTFGTQSQRNGPEHNIKRKIENSIGRVRNSEGH